MHYFPLAFKDWPVTRWGRRFGASRASGERKHAGIDLTAVAGDIVYATEDGTLIASQRFNGPEAYALLQETDSGLVVLYGEVFPNSWREFGLQIGDRVVAGQPVARVGINPGGSQMLHFELYTGGTTQNKRWYSNRPQPAGLFDPGDYLATGVEPGKQPAAVSSGGGGGGAIVLGLGLFFGVGAAWALSKSKR